MRGEDKYDFDMAKVADLVNAAGVFAYVEHTGGGTATIYAGEEVEYEAMPGEMWKVFKVAAGPGTFDFKPNPVWTTLYDFSIGPNDQGEAGYVSPADVGALTEEDIAKLIVAQAGKPFPELLTREEVTALGFDGTGKSKPADMVWEDERSRVWMDAHNAVNQALHESGEWSAHGNPSTDEAGDAAQKEWELTHPHPDPMVAAQMVEEGRLASGYGPIVKVTGPNSLSSPGRAEPTPTEYALTWEIELEARTPREAAQEALNILRSDDPGNIGLVFHVSDIHNTYTIDLSGSQVNADLSDDDDTGSLLDREAEELGWPPFDKEDK